MAFVTGTGWSKYVRRAFDNALAGAQKITINTEQFAALDRAVTQRTTVVIEGLAYYGDELPHSVDVAEAKMETDE